MAPPGALGAAALVVDIGSDTCRAGCAGEGAPLLVLPSSVGPGRRSCLRFAGAAGGRGQSGCSLRWDTEALSAVLERSLAAGGATSHPLFRPPSRQPPLHPVLLSEPNGRSRGYREALAELLFEGLAVPAACLEPSAALTALSFGRTGATVVDVGAGVTSVAQVQDGRVVPARLREHPFAGAALDDALAGLLARQGVELLPAAAASEPRRQSAARRLAQDMKETICWCSHVPLAEAPPSEPFMHTLPDGQEVDVSSFWRAVPEALLTGQPDWPAGPAFPGVPGLLAESLAAEAAGPAGSLGPLLLAGGSSLFVNFRERLWAALSSDPAFAPVVGSPPLPSSLHAAGAGERRHSAWLGGSVLAGTSALDARWASRRDYEEHGSAVFEVRCP